MPLSRHFPFRFRGPLGSHRCRVTVSGSSHTLTRQGTRSPPLRHPPAYTAGLPPPPIISQRIPYTVGSGPVRASLDRRDLVTVSANRRVVSGYRGGIPNPARATRLFVDDPARHHANAGKRVDRLGLSARSRHPFFYILPRRRVWYDVPASGREHAPVRARGIVSTGCWSVSAYRTHQ